MARIRITFQVSIQDSRNLGSDDEHMVSRVLFSLEVGGQSRGHFHCDVKQNVGTDFASAQLEVSPPRGGSYRGPFNHEAFQEEVEEYYRESFGSGGTVIQVGAKNVRMRNNRSVRLKTVEFDAWGSEAAW